MRRRQLLVADPDPGVRRLLARTLRAEGYAPVLAETAADCLALADNSGFIACIAASDLPDIGYDGFPAALRASCSAPLLCLVADLAGHRMADVLDAGADDCLPKPFATAELLTRLRRLIVRRAGLTGAGRTTELLRGRSAGSEARSRLTNLERCLLLRLAAANGGVVAYADLLQTLWQLGAGCGRDHLRHIVSRLRCRIEPVPRRPRYLVTVPGVGYRLRQPAAEPIRRFIGVATTGGRQG